jgi:predicted Zn-dependent protease
MDLRLIQNVLSGRSEVAQWQVTERRSRRHERYLTFLQPDAERETAAVRWQVWIALPEADGRQGEAAFTITPADGGHELRTKLTQAIETARAALNPAWKLPGPGDPGVAVFRRGGSMASEVAGGAATAAQMAVATDFLADQQLVRDPVGALRSASDQFANAAQAVPWTRPSALELFGSVHDRRLVNHLGLDLSERRTSWYAEFVLLHRSSPDADEREFYDRVEAGTLAELRLGERVADAASCLRDGATASAPQPGRQPVVVAGEYLAGLLGWYAAHADAGLHARSVAALAEAQPVLERRSGDRLRLASDATRPSLAAYRFDEHGYAACRQDLVLDDVLVGLHGSGRWMQLLRRQPRGQLSTLVAPAGTTPLADLRRGALEVVRFSEFHPRHDTGAFSGEIRFAWLHGADGSRRPVVGGSVSGVLRDALADSRFSREVVTVGGYCGPEAVRLTATVAV